jgi:hypothetical protein
MNKRRRYIAQEAASVLRAIQHDYLNGWPRDSANERTSVSWTQADVILAQAVMNHKLRLMDLLEDVLPQELDDLYDAAHRDGEI